MPRISSITSPKLLFILTSVICVCFFLIQVSTMLSHGKLVLTDIDEEKAFTINVANNDESNEQSDVSSSSFNAMVQKADCSEKISQEKKRVAPPNVSPDGYFNGNPVKFTKYQEGWHSNVHCVGDNFRKDAWKYRSCHFQNFCFDLHNQSYVLFTSPEQLQLEEAMNHANVTEFKTAFGMKTTVSIGGINQKWGKDQRRLEWFPQLRSINEIENTGYYEFLNDAILLPFHSMAGFNPGHLMWDDFLPIYTLLNMFQLLGKDLVLMRHKPVFWQWASCDRRWSSGNRKPYCKTMLKKFLPLLGQTLDIMTTQENVNMTWTGTNLNIANKTKYVCAANGAAGLGMLTDHGSKLHGWITSDYEVTHNFGRGGLLYEFRNWMMTNIDIDPYASISKAPYKIVFSVHSSSTFIRNIHFKEHMKRLKDQLGSKYQIHVVAAQMSVMSLKEQLELVADASIMVTMCGGGAVTSMFLPKGASLFAFFNEKEAGGDNKVPPRLDWDLVNNLSYLRVHWLPRPQNFGKHYPAPTEADFDAFIRLVDHELDIISHTEG